MAEVTLDPKKMLGFRLLDRVEPAEGQTVPGAESGSFPIEEQMAISAKFGKPGKAAGPS